MSAVSIATAYVQIVPTFDGAQAAIQRGLKGAGAAQAGASAGEEAGKGFGGSFGGHVASVAKLATRLIAGFAGGAAIKSGLNRLTTIQDASTALNVQFGDTAKTADFMNKILETVSGTPFNLDQFATAGKNLVAFGVASDKVPGYLKSLGEAAAASGKGSEAVDMMTDAFGAMATEGAVTNDAINSMAAQGVPALTILANHFGVSTAEMKDMVSKGIVPATEGMDALSEGIMNGSTGVAGSTVAFGGSMAALRETFSGALGGMKASVARFGAGLLKPWLDDMTHGLQNGTSILDNAGKTFATKSQEIRDKIMPALSDAFQVLSKGEFANGVGVSVDDSGLIKFMKTVHDFAVTVKADFAQLWAGMTMDPALITGAESGFVKFGITIRAVFDYIVPYLHDAAGAIRTLITGDFDPSQWGHPVAEDSPIVSGIFTIREKINDAAGFVRTLVSGDFDPSQWGGSTTAESPIVLKAFAMRDKLKEIAVFVRTLVTGDFDPSAWGASGIGEDSPIVDKALTIRDKIIGVIDWIKNAWGTVSGVIAGLWASMTGGDSQAFYDSLGVAGDRTKELVGDVKDFTAALPSWNSVLTVASGLLGFVADHMGTIVEWLPVIIAGFLAYKAATTLVNIANLANIPIAIAQMGVTLVQASAMRALAISQGYVRVGMIAQTWANIKSMAAWIGSTAAMVAHKVASLAVTVATQAMAAAQWLWNAAMDANPIMIVVIAIAALVAGIIWAWNNVDWFRDAVLTAWEWIQEAASWAWENVLKPIFNWIGEAVQKVGDFFTWLWENAIKPAIDFIGAAIQWLWDHVISVYINIWITIIKVLAGIFTWLWENAIQPAIGFIGTAISWVWDNVIKPVFDFISGAITVVGNAFTWLNETIIQPVMTAIGSAIQWAWDNVISPAFELLKTGLQAVGDFFGTIAGAIGTAWDTIKSFAVGPINWIIEHVWNDGIVWLWNKITGWIPGVDISLDKLDLIGAPSTAPTAYVPGGPKAATGGVLPGYSHMDNHNVRLSGGEGILNPEATRGLGAGFVHWANRAFGGSRVAAGYGRTGLGGDGTPGFFFGGLWEGIGNIASGIGDFIGDIASGIADAASFTAGFISDPLGAITGMLGTDTMTGITDLATKSPFGKMVSQLPGSIVGGVISTVKGILGFEDDGKGGKPPIPQSSITGGLNSSQDPSSFGWTRASNIVPFSFNGRMIGGVAGGTEGLWTGLLGELVPQIPGGLNSNVGGYENRDNVNSPGRASFHAYGLAMDINSDANANGVPGYGRSGQYVIPSGPAHSLAPKYGMEWGGDFTGTPDPMHFEIHVSPSQIGAGGTLNLAPVVAGGTAGMNTVDPIVDFGAMNMARGTAAMVGPLPPGGALERWRPLYLQALAMTGHPASGIDAMMNQMRTESSGDPLSYAIDSNYYDGHPSKGLLQTIPSTFRANAHPGYGLNIWDPLSNALASLHYVDSRYGGLQGYQGHAYDTGGMLMPNGVGINLSKQPELVLTQQQWDVARMAIDAVNQGNVGSGITMHVYQQPGQSTADLAREMNRQIVFSGGL